MISVQIKSLAALLDTIRYADRVAAGRETSIMGSDAAAWGSLVARAERAGVPVTLQARWAVMPADYRARAAHAADDMRGML